MTKTTPFIGLLSLVGVSFLTAAPALAGAHGDTKASTCAQAKHKFIEASSAVVRGSAIAVAGHRATFHCGGPDDGHYDTAKATQAYLIDPKAKIVIFKVYTDPSKTSTIKASHLPHWLKHNAPEAVYKVTGPKDDITSMVEEFHP